MSHLTLFTDARNDGGGDDRGRKVGVAGKNRLGKEKPKPIRSTLFLSIEGS